MATPPNVMLRPYAESDSGLLASLLGDADAMRYLGGPENEEQLAARHRRYVSLDPSANWIFVIEVDGRSVGWIGAWCTEPSVCEVGWHVLSEMQGRGVATAVLATLVAFARRETPCRHLDAYPAVENAPSNALCRRAGFVDLGEADVEYPKGRIMRARHWRLDLREADAHHARPSLAPRSA